MKKFPGYIAITAVLILSSILLLVLMSYTYVSILRRLSLQDSSLSVKSRLAAETCLENARLKLRTVEFYRGDELLTVLNGAFPINCIVYPIVPDYLGRELISVQGMVSSTVNRPITHILVYVDAVTLEEVYRRQTQSYTDPSPSPQPSLSPSVSPSPSPSISMPPISPSPSPVPSPSSSLPTSPPPSTAPSTMPSVGFP